MSPNKASNNTAVATPPSTAAAQHIIVRTAKGTGRGQHTIGSSRYTLGYVVCGTKRILRGETHWDVATGEIFFLNRGSHQIVDIPSTGRRGGFEQIVFQYTPEEISNALAMLVMNYGLDNGVNHSCDKCMRRDHVVVASWPTVRQFFESTAAQLKVGFYDDNHAGELLALANLLFHIITQPEGCLRTRVLSSADPDKELMERVVHEYVYNNLSMEELARRNNRSLSSFKKKFKDYYGEPPHRWVVRRRLMHARLQVIQTNKTTLEISHECHFGNCSHFIALFREEYGMTPFQYRKKYRTK